MNEGIIPNPHSNNENEKKLRENPINNNNIGIKKDITGNNQNYRNSKIENDPRSLNNLNSKVLGSTNSSKIRDFVKNLQKKVKK